MAKFIVSGYLTISVTKEIEARDADDAEERAGYLQAPPLCYQCNRAGRYDADTWELNGFDDPPEDCVQHVEEVGGG